MKTEAKHFVDTIWWDMRMNKILAIYMFLFNSVREGFNCDGN